MQRAFLILVAAFKVVFATAFLIGVAVLAVRGRAGTEEWAGLAALLVFASPLWYFLVKDMARFSGWLLGRARAHAYRTDERVYRFGEMQVRMLMDGQNPWFSATDVGRALDIPNVKQEILQLDVTEREQMGGWRETYLSESAVLKFAERSRHADRQHFKVWFSREVMSPLHRARERLHEERKARRERKR